MLTVMRHRFKDRPIKTLCHRSAMLLKCCMKPLQSPFSLTLTPKKLAAWCFTARSTAKDIMHWLAGSREQGWHSGESARLPPMCPGFNSRTWRHKWAEFVGSPLCSERFFSGYSSFPLSPKTNIWFDLIWFDLGIVKNCKFNLRIKKI